METHTETQQAQHQTLLEWEAPVARTHERSKSWYIIAGTIITIVAVYSFISGGWTVGILALLIGGMYWLVRNQETKHEHYALLEEGIQVGERVTPWSKCTSFWILRTEAFTEIHIEKKSRKELDTVLHAGNTNIYDIRAVLQQFIEENTEKKESFLDTISRICKL